MVAEQHRGKRLGKMIMEAIIAHPKLKHIKNFELTCLPEMAMFYEKFNFSKDYGKTVPMRFQRI